MTDSLLSIQIEIASSTQNCRDVVVLELTVNDIRRDPELLGNVIDLVY